jgi:hypothetical protein
VDIPPGVERVFIIEELLDLGNEDEDGPGKVEEIPLRETELLEPVLIPKQYNITYIDVLIRDPLWVFAFWEIKIADKDLYEKADDFEGYHLKVFPLKEKPLPLAGGKKSSSGPDDPFVIPVGIEDSSWYIGFPPAGGRFRVEIGVTRGMEGMVLAASRPFKLPGLLKPPGWGKGENSGDPLIQLSGIDDLPVLRNIDRLSRIHHGYNS